MEEGRLELSGQRAAPLDVSALLMAQQHVPELTGMAVIPASNSAFGGGSAFGAPKPAGGAFGATPAFGGTSAFGQPATSSPYLHNVMNGSPRADSLCSTLVGAFGASATPADPVPPNGSAQVPYSVLSHSENESTPNVKSNFQTITAMDPYKNCSQEELRWRDYQQNRKNAAAPGAPATSAFGQQAGGGAFGASSGAFGQSTGAFGQPAQGGNVFGQTPTSSGGAFGASGTGAFGQAAPSTPAFGSTTGAFGQPATTSAFGQPAQPASSGIFGSSQPAQQPTNVFGAPAQPTSAFGSTGAFGQAKPAFGGTGAFGSSTAGSAFGSTTSAAPTGAFGTSAAPAAGGFGTGTSAFGSGTGAFGQPKPATGVFGATSAPANPFGQPAPAATPAFGGFGGTSTAQQPAASNPFGAPSTGTNVFGQPAQPQQPQNQPGQQQGTGAFGTGTGAFGSSAGGGFGTGTGAFGAGTGGGAFGSSTGSNLFGTKPAGTTGTGLFGSTTGQPATQGSNLFGGGGFNTGAQAQQPQNTFGQSTGSNLFGSSAGTNAFGGGASTGLFGSTAGQQQVQQQPQPTLQASLDQNAYGNNPIFANIPQPGPAVAPLAKKPPPIPVGSSSSTPARPSSVNPKIGKLRGFSKSATSSPFSPAKQSPLSFSTGTALTSSTGSPSFQSSEDATTLSPAAFRSRSSAKKLMIGPGSAQPPRERSSTLDAVNGASPPPKSGAVKSGPVFNADAETRAMQSATPRKPAAPATVVAPRAEPTQPKPPPSTTSRQAHKEVEPSATSTSIAETEEDAAEGQYVLSPPISVLAKLPAAELGRVKDFEVTRKGVGRVRFLEPIDLNGIDKLSDIVGTHLTIEQANVSVDDCEALQGVPAFVSLFGCWAVEKGSRQPLKDAKHQRVAQFERKVGLRLLYLLNLCADCRSAFPQLKKVEGTQFVSYEPDSGTWSFKVDGF